MSKLIRLIAGSLVLLLLGSSVIFAETLYVKSFQAFLLEEPKASAKKLKQLDRGTAVETLQTQGVWIQVKVGEAQGWLSKMVLAETVAGEKVSLLASNVDLSSDARRRASTYSSTAAARGLVRSGQERINSRTTTNFEVLAALEAQIINESEAVHFLEYTEL